jgi:hypothetical protein
LGCRLLIDKTNIINGRPHSCGHGGGLLQHGDLGVVFLGQQFI